MINIKHLLEGKIIIVKNYPEILTLKGIENKFGTPSKISSESFSKKTKILKYGPWQFSYLKNELYMINLYPEQISKNSDIAWLAGISIIDFERKLDELGFVWKKNKNYPLDGLSRFLLQSGTEVINDISSNLIYSISNEIGG